MTATQSKHLIAAARNVLAILPANTDAALAVLQAAIEAAEAPAKPKARVLKTSKLPGYGYYKPWDRALESLDEFCARVEHGFRERSAGGPLTMMEGAQKLDQAAIRERLEWCACGHKAVAHREDENANLLECQGRVHDDPAFAGRPCTCDHFHYQADDDEAQAA